MKSGETQVLIQMEILEGILEKSENSIESAAASFEKLLLSFKDDPMPLFENICLLNLVDIEIEMQHPESIDTNADTSETWMNALMEHLSRHDFPGIATQSKIMKAKFRQKQGRYGEVNRIVSDVLRDSESPSMRYLKNLAKKEFPELVQ
ncbi:MAG: hypothetical protein P1Q69_15965 [Candidatus Thorarchaeota archaeon]|nr:hypothetical protein [Candidatus Thorarchaeota archaeon]